MIIIINTSGSSSGNIHRVVVVVRYNNLSI